MIRCWWMIQLERGQTPRTSYLPAISEKFKEEFELQMLSLQLEAAERALTEHLGQTEYEQKLIERCV